MPVLTEEFVQKAILNSLENEKCSDLHPGYTCNEKSFIQFVATFQSLYKMYLVAHLIPFILFKRKKFKKQPLKEFKKLLIGFLKSMLFACGYSTITRRVICIVAEYYRYTAWNGALGGLIGGVTLVLEPPGRQSQIALFCLNKTMQTLYNMAIRRKMKVRIPYGECLIVALSFSLIAYLYRGYQGGISHNYLRILNILIGDF